MIKIDDVLERLDKVRQYGRNKYQARCPAHSDTDPSLSITVTDKDKILMHCFGGCSIYDVVSAIGLELSDIMGDNPTHHKLRPVAHQDRPSSVPLTKGFNPESYYRAVIDIAKSDAMKNIHSSPEDMKTIQEANNYFNSKNGLDNKPEELLEFEAKRQKGERLSKSEKSLERKLWLRSHRSGKI